MFRASEVPGLTGPRLQAKVDDDLFHLRRTDAAVELDHR